MLHWRGEGVATGRSWCINEWSGGVTMERWRCINGEVSVYQWGGGGVSMGRWRFINGRVYQWGGEGVAMGRCINGEVEV